MALERIKTLVFGRIFVIIPVRNRRETTLRFLHSLSAIDTPENVVLDILVIDDGSSDGTSKAVRAAFPDVKIEQADGSLYWSGAIQRGLERFHASDHAFVWLLNDDVVLDAACLTRLLAVAERYPGRIYSGTVEDADGSIIYGGIAQRPGFRFRKITDADYSDGLAFADTLNGNCALLSRQALAHFDWPRPGIYVHEGFDMFLGLEATRLGVGPVIVRDARCFGERNTAKFWFYSRAHSLRDRLRGICGVKGIYPPMYWHLTWRFAGPLFLLYFLKPYLIAIVGRKPTDA